jgi:hypothetical protein
VSFCDSGTVGTTRYAAAPVPMMLAFMVAVLKHYYSIEVDIRNIEIYSNHRTLSHRPPSNKLALYKSRRRLYSERC